MDIQTQEVVVWKPLNNKPNLEFTIIIHEQDYRWYDSISEGWGKCTIYYSPVTKNLYRMWQRGVKGVGRLSGEMANLS